MSPPSHQHSPSLTAAGAFSVQERKSECLSVSAALTQEIMAAFSLTKSKWAWHALGRGP